MVCVACRTRKIKCSFEKGSSKCQHCLQRDLPCVMHMSVQGQRNNLIGLEFKKQTSTVDLHADTMGEDCHQSLPSNSRRSSLDYKVPENLPLLLDVLHTYISQPNIGSTTDMLSNQLDDPLSKHHGFSLDDFYDTDFMLSNVTVNGTSITTLDTYSSGTRLLFVLSKDCSNALVPMCLRQ